MTPPTCAGRRILESQVGRASAALPMDPARPSLPITPKKFRGQDLNLRPPGYEPGELPLLHPGIYLTTPFGSGTRKSSDLSGRFRSGTRKSSDFTLRHYRDSCSSGSL